MKFILALLAITSASAAVPSLTPANYEELTAGKTVFIKFFAPWCGHCKKMAPDWETLSAEWDGNDIGLIAEVDCTAEGKPLCDENGVKGFPTLKHGDPSALDDYQGGRDLSSMQAFAKENLKPVCSLANIDLCDDEKKAQIDALKAKSAEELEAAIKVEEDKLTAAEDTFKSEVEKLQKTYEALMKTKDATEAEVKGSGLNLMKAVKKAKESGNDEL